MKFAFQESLKKTSLVFAAALIFSVLFTGCSPKAEEETPALITGEQTEITEPLVLPTNTIAPSATPEPTATPKPAGPLIAFISNRSGEPDSRQLHILDLASREIRFVDTGLKGVVFPRWSPDGQWILFAQAGDWNLYIVRPDGSDLTRVTDFRSNNPDWSPDGKSVVFQSDHNGEPQNKPDIYTMNLDGSDLTKIVEDIPTVDYGPRWSSGGNLITFLSGKTGHAEVYVIKPDGSDRRQVTESKTMVVSQDISPDGSRIAFSYPEGKNITDLYTLDISGAVETVVRLTKDEFLKDAPSWTPDGKRIVYYGNQSGAFDLWIINADGSGAENLTNDEYYDAYPDYWAP